VCRWARGGVPARPVRVAGGPTAARVRACTRLCAHSRLFRARAQPRECASCVGHLSESACGGGGARRGNARRSLPVERRRGGSQLAHPPRGMVRSVKSWPQMRTAAGPDRRSTGASMGPGGVPLRHGKPPWDGRAEECNEVALAAAPSLGANAQPARTRAVPGPLVCVTLRAV